LNWITLDGTQKEDPFNGMFGMRLLHKQEMRHERAQAESPTEWEIQMSLLQFLIGFPNFHSPTL